MDGPRGQNDDRAAAETDAGDEQRAGDALADWSRAEEQAKGDLPPTIYYDLTRYDWYAQGEPLRHAQSSYTPGGAPVRMPASRMRRVGQYRGVEIYVQTSDDDSSDTVYVPVFEGFWLPFNRTNRQTSEP